MANRPWKIISFVSGLERLHRRIISTGTIYHSIEIEDNDEEIEDLSPFAKDAGIGWYEL